jgi:hypothetical protein
MDKKEAEIIGIIKSDEKKKPPFVYYRGLSRQ